MMRMSSVSTSYTDIFTSMGIGTSSSSSSSSSISLVDYASIKNGSYGKLLKAYYKQQEAEAQSADETETKQLTALKGNADGLKNATLELMDEDLFEKKTITTKDETTGEETETEDYDWDAITKAVKSFAEKYNTVIEEAGNCDTTSVLKNAAWLTSQTESKSNLLSSVGITIGSDNKLSVDEDELKKANVSTLKLLFQGVGSYADKVVAKAAQISSAASKGANQSGSAYTSSANYTSLTTSGSLYDELF
jgi:hypothetical protein